MKNITLLFTLMLVAANCAVAEVYKPEKRWRGFNLMEMFIKGSGMSPGKYRERDFREIHELGFNFVRLPTDYRFWIKDGNWDQIDPESFKPLDKAIEFGQKYDIHVMLNFHRAPGFTVAKPPEKLNVFKDPEALRVCIMHWGFVAERYKDVPAEDLSFNLFNEPTATPEEYEHVVAALLKEIRRHNSDRLVVCDGINWATSVVPELFKYNVGQACRGYSPGTISHYRASWAGNSTLTPAWPPSGAVSPLYGPMKRKYSKPLFIEGLPACQMIIDPARVSGNVTFEVKAGDKVLAVFPLEPKKGEGWSNADYKKEWGIYQADCDKMLSVDIPPNAGKVSISIVKGDWAGIDKLTLKSKSGKEAVLSFSSAWYKVNPLISFKGFEHHSPFALAGQNGGGVEWLKENVTGPWVKAANEGQFIVVGEFGAYKYTPHDIVLDWMEDYLQIWKEADMGWALWNFEGSFGIINSGRDDVAYDDFHGRKLDRKMLDLLLKY